MWGGGSGQTGPDLVARGSGHLRRQAELVIQGGLDCLGPAEWVMPMLDSTRGRPCIGRPDVCRLRGQQLARCLNLTWTRPPSTTRLRATGLEAALRAGVHSPQYRARQTCATTSACPKVEWTPQDPTEVVAATANCSHCEPADVLRGPQRVTSCLSPGRVGLFVANRHGLCALEEILKGRIMAVLSSIKNLLFPSPSCTPLSLILWPTRLPQPSPGRSLNRATLMAVQESQASALLTWKRLHGS